MKNNNNYFNYKIRKKKENMMEPVKEQNILHVLINMDYLLEILI